MFGRRRGPAGMVVLAAALCACAMAPVLLRDGPVSTVERACSLPGNLLELTKRGHVPGRSGDIALIPATPAYMTDRGGGWPHSGPWPYLQRVPLVFYAPGLISAHGSVEDEATLADVAPTLARLLGIELPSAEGHALPGAGPRAPATAPKLIVTVVWDGGGRNVLERWPGAWPTLASLMHSGVSFERATVGSSPSVTPAVHTTLGTGTYPRTHGIPLIRMRGSDGTLDDSFLDGASSAAIKVPTLAEAWDQRTAGDALVGMVGYEPWHLGMIGKGAELPGGDKDHAVWVEGPGRWITNPRHYAFPPNFYTREGIPRLLRELDAEDGRIDNSWGRRAPLTDPTRLVETPAFARYHLHELIGMIEQQGYGDDGITDLIFTNFKQIDRNGHRYNMESREVENSVRAADDVLGDLVTYLEGRFDPGEFVLVVTADHGQQPDAEDVRGRAIEPAEVVRDIGARFGPITESVLPTEVFLDHRQLRQTGATVGDVVRFLNDYRFKDNDSSRPLNSEKPIFEQTDRAFSLAIGVETLETLRCGAEATR